MDFLKRWPVGVDGIATVELEPRIDSLNGHAVDGAAEYALSVPGRGELVARSTFHGAAVVDAYAYAYELSEVTAQ